MDVEGLAQMRGAHRRAFDVPARPTAAPRTVPARLIGERRLPQHEVGRILLVRRHLDPRAGDQLVARAPRQSAVVAHARHAEQHVAFGGIGVAVGDQALDHGDHLADILRGTRFDVGGQRAEAAHVALVGVAGAPGQRLDALVVVGGPHDDAVVDVGDVAHVGDARISPLEQAIEHVEHHDRPRIADMDIVVDGRAADIETHMACIERHERFFFARQRVVDDEGHRPYSPISFVRSADRPRNGARTSVTSRAAAPGNTK